MSSPLADIFHEAAGLNRQDPRREGNTVHLESGCEVMVAGDLHGHRANLAKIIAYADLGAREDRRLILQEIVHGKPDARTGQDRSMEALLRAARLKIDRPGQVVFLLGNHDLAQAVGGEITKAGRGVCEAFVAGVRYACGDDADEVLEAIDEFLLSLPIAACCPGGVMVCHTLPTPRRTELAGEEIPQQPYRDADLHRGGRVYEWTWGRKQTPEQIDRLAERLGVAFFVLGHRHIETPYEVISPKAIIITSEHDRGCILCFDSDAAMDGETAPNHVKPIAALARRR